LGLVGGYHLSYVGQTRRGQCDGRATRDRWSSSALTTWRRDRLTLRRSKQTRGKAAVNRDGGAGHVAAGRARQPSGQQLLSCLCDDVLDWEDGVPDDDRLPWTGTFPGVAECLEFGWYAKRAPIGWQSCSADDPAAIPDLNRLYTEAIWDREHKRWVKK
jgi:hypothetical protein